MIEKGILTAVADALGLLLTVYSWIIIARALISWVDPNPYNPVVNFLYSVTEPVLERVRAVVPTVGGFDLSPIVVLILIMLLRQMILSTLYGFAHNF